MIAAALILTMSALLAAMVWVVAIRAGHAVSTLEEWERGKFEVNAGAVECLLDSNEEGYLRRSLTAEQFQVVQRTRTECAIECVERIGKNAGMLVQLAEHLGAGTDTQRAGVARALANLAMRVRLSSFVVVWCLRVQWLVPFAGIHCSAGLLRYPELLALWGALVAKEGMGNRPPLQFSGR